MTDTFDYLKQLIENGLWGENLPSPPKFKEACHQRLFNALASQSTSVELIGLIRHFLRREDEDMQGGTPLD